jgi:hypothetical protein
MRRSSRWCVKEKKGKKREKVVGFFRKKAPREKENGLVAFIPTAHWMERNLRAGVGPCLPGRSVWGFGAWQTGSELCRLPMFCISGLPYPSVSVAFVFQLLIFIWCRQLEGDIVSDWLAWFVDSSVPFITITMLSSNEYPSCCQEWRKRDEQTMEIKGPFGDSLTKNNSAIESDSSLFCRMNSLRINSHD